ncbi:M28 family peptidase [Tenacibaculum sp. MEBiC06402]|uniref:M28 family peptidase n=1 Tax=unclassified Tenacibaculum TaxID=2635139 RepID=UPI003B9B6B36
MTTTNKTFTLFILLLAVYWGFHDMKPSSDEVTENSIEELSITNALHHLNNISQKPHHVGTSEHKKVQNYLFTELKNLGLEPEIQTKTVFNKKWRAGTTVENIIAKIKGSSDGKSLLVASHYDSNPHSSIGASDAGSGIVTILEGIRAFLVKNIIPKNDIIILFTDAEEIGLLGAEAFVKYHPEAKNVGLVLNFEARGSGGPSYMLMETNGKNSHLLKEFLNANTSYPAANSLMYSVYKMLPNDTDLTVFREGANINGFNFAFIGDHFDYHTVMDNYRRLDRSSLAHQKDYFVSCLNYFSETDLSKLNSDKDYVFVNFPFIGLLTFPFAWILPLIVIAIIILIGLIFIGIRKKALTELGILKGSIPFLASLTSGTVVTILLWKLILILHPSYNDMLHGFTYNGYYYIAAFCLLNIWIVFKIYNQFKNIKSIDLLVFPIIFWVLINILIYNYIRGAAFFLIPIFTALLVLSLLIIENKRVKNLTITILFIPSLYIFGPLIKMFPVGLGLKNLFISAIFIALLLGLLIPIFHQNKRKNQWVILAGIGTILFFFLATINSGFSIDRRKPNSLVYIQNIDTKTAYWGTYNKTLDNYTKQIFDQSFTEGSIKNAETVNKYNRKFNYLKKADYKEIKTSIIQKELDTIIGNEREIWLKIQPQRDITKYEIFNNNQIQLSSLSANSAPIYEENKNLKKQTLLIYHLGNEDKGLNLRIKFQKDQKLHLTLNEVSNELLSHSSFNLKVRDDKMMPMPFVTNDAIISSKEIIIE